MGYNPTSLTRENLTDTHQPDLMAAASWVSMDFQAAGRVCFNLLAFGWTSGTDAPCGCLKANFARNRSVPSSKSASGSTTLKFLCM